MTHNRNGGFTLVELMVTILCSTLVTVAALTMLLLGVRVNRQSIDTVSAQNTVHIVLDALEKVATEGAVTKVDTDTDYWCISGKPGGAEEDIPLFTYDGASRTIYAGAYSKNGENSPVLENVLSSFVTLDAKNKVLTFRVETEDGIYSTAVYCRTANFTFDNEQNVGEQELVKVEESTDTTARTAFLKALSSQYRLSGGAPNPGLILDADKFSTGQYYAEWYINNPENKEWNGDTPWCACFVSWGLNQVSKDHINDPIGYFATVKDAQTGEDILDPHWFASVDRFCEALVDEENNMGHAFRFSEFNLQPGMDEYIPQPGDIIFIDWEGDRDPDHVGAVLTLAPEDQQMYVYTIEGNSAGIVAVRRYPIDNKIIFGYGVIDWKTTDPNS